MGARSSRKSARIPSIPTLSSARSEGSIKGSLPTAYCRSCKHSPVDPLLTMGCSRQSVATYSNGLGLLEPFRGGPICRRLLSVATTRLHKGSILSCQTKRQRPSASEDRSPKVSPPGARVALRPTDVALHNLAASCLDRGRHWRLLYRSQSSSDAATIPVRATPGRLLSAPPSAAGGRVRARRDPPRPRTVRQQQPTIRALSGGCKARTRLTGARRTRRDRPRRSPARGCGRRAS